MKFRVELAEESGFCFGVKRAIELARATTAREGTAYSLGPIIHNPQEVARLTRGGVRVVDSLDQVPEGAPLIIRSHGATPEVFEEARRRGLAIVDATCLLVKRAQERAGELAEGGYRVVVVGEVHHPEVQAIVEYARGAVVLEDGGGLDALRTARRIGVVAQTTQSPGDYRQVLSRLLALEFSELRVYNTVCRATLQRQRAAGALAQRADVMIVVGGQNSANTRRLAEFCGGEGVPTYHIETAADLEPGWLVEVGSGGSRGLVGVTGGASTPDWVIEEVVEQLCQMGGSFSETQPGQREEEEIE